MREAEQTTRQRITDQLREQPMQAGAIANEFDITTKEALSHVEHISKSLAEGSNRLLVAPPECRECGFNEFDDLINRPSRCPDCKSENVEEPMFRVD